ncbi:MAG TPA: aminopeptidase, partial [Candidatus Tetragenococcus pullicola]|nr:aminopeptidase [Candidatus Tetragenococcus pullicola]
GVDLIDDKPVKWKVENSWGDKFGDKGYFIMSDDWFDTYLYEVVINKKYVDDQSLKITKQPVENVAPWDSLR